MDEMQWIKVPINSTWTLGKFTMRMLRHCNRGQEMFCDLQG